MQVTHAKVLVPLVCAVSLFLVSGCVDYKRKYDYLNVEHQNLKGRFENLQAEKQQLAARISQDQETINELQRQIEELNRTPADATGFGEGYDVAFDAAAGTITVTLPNTILFDSGKASLKNATSAELDHILSVVKQKYAGKEIDVVGHTDTDPIKKSKWRDNWQLSSERALSVVAYLEKRGIPANQIRAVGCGQSRPVASNATSAGKAKNRRVEIVVHLK
jgi:chemotaxis protein MotB